MNFIFKKLAQQNALIMANNWKYDGEYTFYDMTEDVEDYNEFISEEFRNKNDFFQATLNDQLVGYFCLINDDNKIEIGLGLKPDMCGKGLGRKYVSEILDFIMQNYRFDKLIMNVALFNERAIKVYQNFGFKAVKIYNQETNGGIFPFLRLEK